MDRSIQKPQNTTVRYQKQESLQSSVLMALCHALKHNFFADIAALLPQEYTTNAPTNSEQTNKIAELEQEIIMLNREKNLLLEALKKG
ncbi:MAG: hypothetical protein JHD28_04545 [Bacteroidia bacterium]|nr:hypothetical protein [Bacteroidia bacterium]